VDHCRGGHAKALAGCPQDGLGHPPSEDIRVAKVTCAGRHIRATISSERRVLRVQRRGGALRKDDRGLFVEPCTRHLRPELCFGFRSREARRGGIMLLGNWVAGGGFRID